MVLYLFSVLLGVCVPESHGAAPATAHCPHAVGVLLARAEGYQPPTLRTHLSLPGKRKDNEASITLLWGTRSLYMEE